MKINIKKKALSVLLSCVLVSSNAYAKLENKGDYVSANSNVNMRLGEEIERKKRKEKKKPVLLSIWLQEHRTLNLRKSK